MIRKLRSLRSGLGISLTWGILWAVVWTSVGMIIGIVDPDSIAPGESPFIPGAFLGLMGLFSGFCFCILLLLFERDRTVSEMSLIRVVLWGILGSAFAQLGFLVHGDLGIGENIKQGLLFVTFGGVAAIVGLLIARRWLALRSFLWS